MIGDVEQAAGGRGVGDYPREWGTPPGGRFSAERAAWVRGGVRKWLGDPARRLRKLEQIEHRQQVAALLADVRTTLRTARLTAAERDHLADVESELDGLL